jgi:hypothetical protein
MQTDFARSIEHGPAARLIEEIRGLIPLLALACNALCIHLRERRAENIVLPIHRTGFVTVQV